MNWHEQLPRIDYTLLPNHIRNAVRLYIEHGIAPGGFLQAVICNDLRMAYITADTTNRSRLSDIVKFFFEVAPASCWGSFDTMVDWIAQGGLGNE